MEYKFRKIAESDNSIIAGIIRKSSLDLISPGLLTLIQILIISVTVMRMRDPDTMFLSMVRERF